MTDQEGNGPEPKTVPFEPLKSEVDAEVTKWLEDASKDGSWMVMVWMLAKDRMQHWRKHQGFPLVNAPLALGHALNDALRIVGNDAKLRQAVMVMVATWLGMQDKELRASLTGWLEKQDGDILADVGQWFKSCELESEKEVHRAKPPQKVTGAATVKMPPKAVAETPKASPMSQEGAVAVQPPSLADLLGAGELEEDPDEE